MKKGKKSKKKPMMKKGKAAKLGRMVSQRGMGMTGMPPMGGGQGY